MRDGQKIKDKRTAAMFFTGPLNAAMRAGVKRLTVIKAPPNHKFNATQIFNAFANKELYIISTLNFHSLRFFRIKSFVCRAVHLVGKFAYACKLKLPF